MLIAKVINGTRLAWCAKVSVMILVTSATSTGVFGALVFGWKTWTKILRARGEVELLTEGLTLLPLESVGLEEEEAREEAIVAVVIDSK